VGKTKRIDKAQITTSSLKAKRGKSSHYLIKLKDKTTEKFLTINIKAKG